MAQSDTPSVDRRGFLKGVAIAGGAGVAAPAAAQAPAAAPRPSVAPPTAQFAVREGAQLAANVLRRIAGTPTRPFRYKARGMLATIGKLNGVAEVFGVRFSGLTAWLVWRAFYLGLMPTLGRKVRIYVEWTWGMFFSADITHFRFSRSEPAD